MSYIVAIGSACLDEYYKAEKWIEEGNKASVRMLSPVVGGMIANTACVISQCGVKSYLVDTMNRSSCTELILSDLIKYGVDVSHIRYDDALPDGKCIIILTDKERTLFSVRLDKPLLQTEPDMELFKNADYIYSKFDDFLRVDSPLGFSGEMRRAGVQTAFDVESFSGSYNEHKLLCDAGVVFFNQYGASDYEKAMGSARAWTELFRYGVKVVAVTMGDKGCDVYTPGAQYHVPAFNVPITDTTGAGDTFNGAFLSRLCLGDDPLSAARYASAAAACCVMNYGAKRPDLSDALIRELMGNKL